MNIKILISVMFLLLGMVYSSCNCGDSLNVPNAVCNVTSDQYSPDASCFVVQAQNVTINCNGFSLVGNDANFIYGIASSSDGTVIKNCNISKFDVNIRFNHASYGSIENVNATRTTTHLFCPSAVASVELFNGSNYNNLTNVNSYSNVGHTIYLSSYNCGYPVLATHDNRLTNVTGISTWVSGSIPSRVGIYLLMTDNNILENVKGSSSNDTGLYLFQSNHNSINNFDVNSFGKAAPTFPGGWLTTSRGLRLESSNYNDISNGNIFSNEYALETDGSSYNIFSNIVAVSTNGTAILIYGTATNTSIINCTANNTGISAFQYAGGIYLTGGDYGGTVENIQVINSTAISYLNSPIVLNRTSNNLFKENTLISGTNSTTLLAVSANSGGNSFCWNNFTTTNALYADDSNGGNFYNASACGGEGNIWKDVTNGSLNISGATPSTYAANWTIGSNGTAYPYSAANGARVSPNVVDYAPLIPPVKIFKIFGIARACSNPNMKQGKNPWCD